MYVFHFQRVIQKLAFARFSQENVSNSYNEKKKINLAYLSTLLYQPYVIEFYQGHILILIQRIVSIC